MIDIRRTAALGENPLDRLETSYRPNMADACDTKAEEWAEVLRLNREQLGQLVLLMRDNMQAESAELASKMLIPVVTYLNEAKGNKTLRYYAFLLAAGDTSVTLGRSYAELARRIGVTRAALSQAVIKMQEMLGFTAHNNFQKSEAARESSRKAAIRSWKQRHEEETHNE